MNLLVKAIFTPVFFLLLFLTSTSVTGQHTEIFTDPIHVDYSGENEPSVIEIFEPEELIEKNRAIVLLNANVLTIKGKVSDNEGVDKLRINNKEVLFSSSGNFETNVKLIKGENELRFEVTDKPGYVTQKAYILVNKEGSDPIAEDIEEAKGKYYALIVGVNEYADPSIIDLDNPIKDAGNLKDILTEHYTFDLENIFTIENASRKDIIDALDELNEKITPNDNFLMFYAGHGFWDKEAEIGYWIPTDGSKDSKADWFRNSTLRDYLKEIDSRHTLLIADACFAGSIFKSRGAFTDASVAINKLYELPSRKAMTSGTLSEVPDKSIFARYLINRLENNTDKYLTSEQLFNRFRIAVINNSNVIPQYGTIQNVGDEGGDFIFIRRNSH